MYVNMIPSISRDFCLLISCIALATNRSHAPDAGEELPVDFTDIRPSVKYLLKLKVNC